MNLIRHKRIFNTIAPLYNLFYKKQYRAYSDLINNFGAKLSIPENGTILDIGCGTGALLQAFISCGYEAGGIDMASAMIHQARRKGLNCSLADALEGLDQKDKSVDLVSASFVAHGLDKEKRLRLYREAKRLSRNKVLIHDYSSRGNIIISTVEYLEGGDYFNFIKSGLDEMREIFTHVEVININKHSNWYICTV